jgi:hypothetical protein
MNINDRRKPSQAWKAASTITFSSLEGCKHNQNLRQGLVFKKAAL